MNVTRSNSVILNNNSINDNNIDGKFGFKSLQQKEDPIFVAMEITKIQHHCHHRQGKTTIIEERRDGIGGERKYSGERAEERQHSGEEWVARESSDESYQREAG